MICTGSYKNCNTNNHKLISISGDRGKSVNFNGEYYSALAPKKEFWTIWHNNIEKIKEEENIKYYIKEYYKQVLLKLDAKQVYNELDNSILLCYEDEGFCHRHIVSAWFELVLNIEVPEVKIDESMKLKILDKTEYIKDILKIVMAEKSDKIQSDNAFIKKIQQKNLG